MKKIITSLLCTITLISNTAFAISYPQAFWGANTNYVNALEGKDYPNIIKYGEEIVKIMKTLPDSPEKIDILVTRLNEIGSSYSELGQYEKSAQAYSELLQYAGGNDSQYGEYIKGAKARVMQYKSRAQMYISGGSKTYYGGKNEPQNGVLFGIVADSTTREKIPNETMTLTYQEIGQSLLPFHERVMSEAAANNTAVLFALNCPNEGEDIRNINNLTWSLNEASSLFSKYSQVPVYVRFGAEFDVWGNMATAEEYKEAFSHVANFFHSCNPNVAMVWSPNQVSSWNVNRDDYYPGDKYVDWVGVSLYSSKYFLGDKNQSEFNNIYFKTGDSSDPVLAIEDIVKNYGMRKPIMISEGGASHKLISTGEDMTDFALKRMRETYSYLPIVYPQIKLIAYFDAFVPSGVEKFDFRLYNNPQMQKEFIHLTKDGRFIQKDYKNSSSVSYRPVTDRMYVDNVFEVATYAHSYKKDVNKVTYFIDGKYVGMSSTIPYSTHIDARGFTGEHILKGVVEFTDGTIKETQAVINIASSNKLTVTMNGKLIEFEQDPVIYNDTTMVPMRKIFEELGMTVNWNGETRTVTATGNGKTIVVSIDESIMYVNNNTYILETAPMILGGSTLVPARAVSEAMECKVEWLGEKYQVKISH